MHLLTRTVAIRQSNYFWQNVGSLGAHDSYSRMVTHCSGAVSSRFVLRGTRSLSTLIYSRDAAGSTPLGNGSTTLHTPDPADKVDLRIGHINLVTKHPEADKLLLLSVDIGEKNAPELAETRWRTIVSGLADYYTPEQLTGMKIVVFANLKPRKLRGIESQGMLLAASSTGEGDITKVEVLEAPPATNPGERVFASSMQRLFLAGHPLAEKPSAVSQRIAKNFIQNLALDAGIATYSNERLVTESGSTIATKTMQAGVVG